MLANEELDWRRVDDGGRGRDPPGSAPRLDLLTIVYEDNGREYGWEYGFVSANLMSLQFAAA
jgi:hypothetical protein